MLRTSLTKTTRWLLPLMALSLTGCGVTQSVTDGTRSAFNAVFYKKIKVLHRLNGLDEQKGKYMTVSELKSVVFSAMQSFNQSIPAEEQLRRLSQYPAGNLLPEGEKTQLELHLKQLATRYAQIKQDASAQ